MLAHSVWAVSVGVSGTYLVPAIRIARTISSLSCTHSLPVSLLEFNNQRHKPLSTDTDAHHTLSTSYQWTGVYTCCVQSNCMACLQCLAVVTTCCFHSWLWLPITSTQHWFLLSPDIITPPLLSGDLCTMESWHGYLSPAPSIKGVHGISWIICVVLMYLLVDVIYIHWVSSLQSIGGTERERESVCMWESEWVSERLSTEVYVIVYHWSAAVNFLCRHFNQ